MPTVIAIASTKGGVTKTTTTANLAGILADFGMHVLVMDGDQQPSLTKYYPIVSRAPHGLTQVITRGGLVTEDCISKTAVPGLDIICSDVAGDDNILQSWLKEREDRLFIMRRAVRRSPVLERYQVVLIDTQGAVGELQKTAAMAADRIISPIKPDILSANEFAGGTLAMLRSINAMADFNPDLRSGDLYVLISALDRSKNSREIAEHIRRHFIGQPYVKGVLNTVIPHAAAYTAAATHQVPVHRYDKRRNVENSAWEVMHRLAWELFPELDQIYVDSIDRDEADPREGA
ncbi:ParA family protein [Achromobacter aloeverae]